MKVIALGTLSGATGDREKGEEFTVDPKLGADLIARALVRQVAESTATTEKAAKAKE
ncbi:hypothetical protein HBO34_05255 [Pseudomonas veronii]|jgi:hypothetical protein|uniref:hypothetical protein n=1 Tax=Pseudomonas veronii TaxID=76761 RepID=UPI0014754DE9|nr:hypothetical protein [Pseudomonas veronii]NMX37283.1 hypothetical protein [Pseudomonas veronii]NWC56530.1 hypothetical protein [Pseudomonas veronii]